MPRSSSAFLYGFTQWLEEGRGLSPLVAGLVLLPVFGVGIAVAAITGRRAAIRGKLVVGALAQTVACALLFLFGDTSPIWLILVCAVYLGAIVASAAGGGFLGDRADSPGLHHLAVFLVGVAGAFVVLTLVDRSLARVGRRAS